MQKKIVSLAAPILIGIMAMALGWFAHAAMPLSAQGIVVDGHATRSDPAAPAAPAGGKANLTYQGRLTNSSGAPINAPVSMTFRIYTGTPNIAIWTSTTRSVTPNNGLFTVYLGDQPSFDPPLPFDTLAQAASIGVTVGGDAEMTPRQALRSVVGHSLNEVGVVGSSDTGYGVNGSSNSLSGVNGSSNSGTGVNGSSNSGDGVVGSSTSSNGVIGYGNSGEGVVGSSTSGDGVLGQTGNATRAGVLAKAAGSSGIALEIYSGVIKATGAGGGTSTFAFIHVSSVANSTGGITRIDNALTNGDQNAMLFVTHVVNPTGILANFWNLAFGVDYDTSSSKWTIFREDGQDIPAGYSFNVMVIKR